MTCRPFAAADSEARDDIRWELAGLFVAALTRRDFSAMAACLDPSVRFRALLPDGPTAGDGAAETADRFRYWFGPPHGVVFEDASIGQIGTRLYLRWRVRRGSADDPDSVEMVEQHVFVTAAERIETIDLLSSGFDADGANR